MEPGPSADPSPVRRSGDPLFAHPEASVLTPGINEAPAQDSHGVIPCPWQQPARCRQLFAIDPLTTVPRCRNLTTIRGLVPLRHRPTPLSAGVHFVRARRPPGHPSAVVLFSQT